LPPTTAKVRGEAGEVGEAKIFHPRMSQMDADETRNGRHPSALICAICGQYLYLLAEPVLGPAFG